MISINKLLGACIEFHARVAAGKAARRGPKHNFAATGDGSRLGDPLLVVVITTTMTITITTTSIIAT